MAKNRLRINLLNFIIILVISGIHGVNIQLYRHPNFTGLLWHSNSSEKCNNIPMTENANVYSIRTDTCFIAYNHADCEYPYSAKFMPAEINLAPNQLGRDGYIKSFYLCSEQEGGDQLDIDITHYFLGNSSVLEVLENYTNVCSCVDVPQYVQQMQRWSINGHHNAFLAYFEPDCSENKWDAMLLAAERMSDANGIYTHFKMDTNTNTPHKIQSFGPDPNSTYFQTSCSFFDVPNQNWMLAGTNISQRNSNAPVSVKMNSLWALFSSLMVHYATTFT